MLPTTTRLSFERRGAARVPLPRKQEKLLAALLDGKSVTAAASDAGLSRQRASALVNRDIRFRAALSVEQATARMATRASLASAASDALTTLRALLAPEHSPRVRVLAAGTILRYASTAALDEAEQHSDGERLDPVEQFIREGRPDLARECQWLKEHTTSDEREAMRIIFASIERVAVATVRAPDAPRTVEALVSKEEEQRRGANPTAYPNGGSTDDLALQV